MVMESPEALAPELEESSMLPPEQPARDNAITAAALAATNFSGELHVHLFLLPLGYFNIVHLSTNARDVRRETFHPHNSHTTELHHTACDRHPRLSHPMFVADCYNQTGFEPAIKCSYYETAQLRKRERNPVKCGIVGL